MQTLDLIYTIDRQLPTVEPSRDGMGVAFSSLWSSLFGQKELKICILGLDNAGEGTGLKGDGI